MAEFIHLHAHSDYSLLDGAASIRSLVERTRQLEMTHLALTDHGNMFGAVKFDKECKANGITPIIGSEFYIAPGSRFKKAGSETRYHHLILLAQNETGYRNLLELSSKGYTEGFYYKPRIDSDLLENHCEGLICLTSCLAGEIPSLLLAGRAEQARDRALYYDELLGRGRFYLELQDHGIAEEKRVNPLMHDLSRQTGIPLVATNDIHYPTREDARAQDILICIGTNKKVTEGNRLKFDFPEFYFKSAQEMVALFGDIPEALSNTLAIAEMCNLDIPLPGPKFPEYHIPEGHTVNSYLETLARQGLQNRYEEITPTLLERLEYELSMICSLGFAGYFLITWDFVRFAKDNDIPVGPGRGSGASSLVAYSLRITDIDPLKYGLLFDRFINPERVTLPDFDIDFCYERRGEVIGYVAKKYGVDRVCQIITFGTLGARAAIRDVARVLDIPYSEADRIAKLVPDGPKVTLSGSLSSNPELGELKNQNETMRELFDISLKLEGLARHASTHAAGIVIGQDELSHYVPLYCDSKTGAVSTQYTMDYLEECGLVKMDFLGLKTLTIIDKTVRMVRERGVELDISRIDESDGGTFDLLGDGKSMCVFQFESSGMRGILRRDKPASIQDLANLSALYRPGPMENIDQYINSKLGLTPIAYPLPELETLLKETYGVIIYQEQVMQIARKVSGYSLGQADILRRAMGKKKPEVMEQQKKNFIEGAQQNGHTKKSAIKIFELLIPFAGYGFAKPHAVAYAVLSYQTAYLKANYPAEFMAANLTSVVHDTDKLAQYIAEARGMGIELLPPHINLSETEFAVADGKIFYGLCGIKNVGLAAADSLIQERKKNGAYNDIFDLFERVDTRALTRKTLEALIQTGVLDSFGVNRATLAHNLDRLLEESTHTRESRELGQESLFDSEQLSELSRRSLEHVEEWPGAELLKLEKENLGFFFSGHPLDGYRARILEHTTLDLSRVENASPGRSHVLIGIIKELKEIMTRKGKRMAFCTLEDIKGTIELVIFPDTFEKSRGSLENDNIVAVRGKLDKSRGEPKFLVNEALPPESLEERRPSEVHVRFSDQLEGEAVLYTLREFLLEQDGDCALFLHMGSRDKDSERVVRASTALSISANGEVLAKMKAYPFVADVWRQ